MFNEKIKIFSSTRKSKIFGVPKIRRIFQDIKSMKYFLYNKKAQLGIIEFKFAMIGFIVGIIFTIVIIILSKNGVLPFKIPFI